MAKEKNGLKEIVSNSVFVFGIYCKIIPGFFVCSLGLAALTAILKVFRNTLIVKAIINTVQYNRAVRPVIIYTIAILLFSLILEGLNTLYNECILTCAKQKFRKNYHGELFRHTLKMDLCCYDMPEFYDDFLLVTSKGLDSIWAMFDALKTVFSSVIAVGTLLSVVFSVDIVGLYIGIASVAVSFVFDTWRNNRMFHREVDMIKTVRVHDYVSRIFSLPEYAKEIRVHKGFVQILLSKYKEGTASAKQIINKYSRQIVIADSLTYFLSTYLLIYGFYCGYLAYKIIVLKTLSLGDFVGMYQAVRLLRNQMMMVTYAAAPTLKNRSMYITKYRAFLMKKPQIVAKLNMENVPLDLRRLCVRNVEFSYSEKEKQILRNINMNIAKNSKIAIVGYNGAGKTTFVKLLLRLYDVTSGEIYINDSDIRNIDIEEYRNKFGVIFQDFQLYATTVAENVAMGFCSEENRERVYASLEKTGVKELAMNYPDDIDTQMTTEFVDSGVSLSGGEAQRLAISRVLYSDAQCLVMDEPSSALDPISEYKLNKLIYEVSKDKMVIYISHRLSTTVLADCIYMFENGEIVEQGTHAQLMELNGKYAYMFNLQAAQYIKEGAYL